MYVSCLEMFTYNNSQSFDFEFGITQ